MSSEKFWGLHIHGRFKLKLKPPSGVAKCVGTLSFHTSRGKLLGRAAAYSATCNTLKGLIKPIKTPNNAAEETSWSGSGELCSLYNLKVLLNI